MRSQRETATPPSGTTARRGGPSPSSAKRSKTVRMAVVTASSGSRRTSPSSSPHTRPDRQPAPQLAARGLVADAAVQPSAQDMELSLRHRALQPQHQPIVERARIIDAILVCQYGVGQPTQVEQTVPVGVVAGQPGNLQPQDDADVTQSDLRGELGEAGAIVRGRWRRRPGLRRSPALGPRSSRARCARATKLYWRSVDSRFRSSWVGLDWRT